MYRDDHRYYTLRSLDWKQVHFYTLTRPVLVGAEKQTHPF